MHRRRHRLPRREARGPRGSRSAWAARRSPLGAARRVAGRAERRADGGLHAAPGLDRGRPRHARLHDQRDRRARRHRRDGRPVRRPRTTWPPRLRAVRESVFADDPLRLLRAVRLEDELDDFRMDAETESLVRRDAQLVARPAGERILAELRRLSAGGLPAARRARPARAARRRDRRPPRPRGLARLSARRGLRRRSAPPARCRTSSGASPRLSGGPSGPKATRARSTASAAPPSRGRSRRSPFSERPTSAARSRKPARAEPAEPLLRGDELDLPPGPEIGRLLAQIEEERAAGTIGTKKEALDYARRNSGAVRKDG